MAHTFSLTPRGSFSWSASFGSLTRLPPLRHVWSGDERAPTLSLLRDGDHAPVRVALRFDGALHGTVSGVSDASVVDAVARQVARIFSLDHDGTAWDAIAARRTPIGAVIRRWQGLRPVCFSSPYEAACWGVVSQRITMSQAANVFAALVREHGSFPTPRAMLGVTHVPGLAAHKVERLRAVAAAAEDGALDAERLRALGDEAGPASLRRIPGIGPFWSSGIYLRACGIADVFPDEPRAIAALVRLYGLGSSPSADAIERVTSRFRPFRMWACFVLRVDAAQGLSRNLTSAAELN